MRFHKETGKRDKQAVGRLLGASVCKGQVEEEEHTWNKIQSPHSDLQTPTRVNPLFTSTSVLYSHNDSFLSFLNIYLFIYNFFLESKESLLEKG